jgi:hypothetical protein
MNLSNNNDINAEKIVFQSMANNWAGLFELKGVQLKDTKPLKTVWTIKGHLGSQMKIEADTLDEARLIYSKNTGVLFEDTYDFYARN